MTKDKTTHSTVLFRLKKTDISEIDAIASTRDLSRSALLRIWISERLSQEKESNHEVFA